MSEQGRMRLNRFLATCGLCSRRAADTLIQDGHVRINGTMVTELGTLVDPEKDRVVVRGKRQRLPEKRVVLLMNKPLGVICTAKDEKGRRTVVDLVDLDRRIVPVGRLDAESTGALLLTDDGDLLNLLTHPRHHVPKEYLVLTDRDLTEEQLARFAAGIKLDGRKTLPCEIERVGRPGARPRYRIVLREGRNRQIRRMMGSFGLTVQKLRRRMIGPLSLGKLNGGEWRFLSVKEVDLLRRAAKLDNSSK